MYYFAHSIIMNKLFSELLIIRNFLNFYSLIFYIKGFYKIMNGYKN